MRPDIAVVMITVNRSPMRNYLGETLHNLVRGGLFTSPRVKSLLCCPSRTSDGLDWIFPTWLLAIGGWVPGRIVTPAKDYCANENVARALEAGAADDVQWVLFLEDDIDVCARFFDSVGAWLDDHADGVTPIYSFGASYPQVDNAVLRGLASWDYPIDKFYGTQALAIRAHNATSLAAYLRAHCYDRAYDGTAYDLLMADWARGQGHSHFLASCPSFVQHIGRSSCIRPRASTHVFESWPGREWAYPQPQQAIVTNDQPIGDGA